MGIHNLERMFQPESVAVIGANERKESIGAALMRNLIQGKYPGKIYPVNVEGEKMWGRQVFRSVADIQEPVDLAIIATPIDTVPQLVRECGQIQAGGAVLISAGGKEIGGKGKEIETAIRREAETFGLRLIGPNCMGITCSQSALNASFASQMPHPGKTAFISQSGSMYTSILDISLREKIGFSYFVSLGSMLDVDFGDVIDYLGGVTDVSSILIYIEDLSRHRTFMSAARSVSRVKPIIAMKAGKTRPGISSTASLTGAMTSEDAIYDAAFKRAGIVRVKTFEELFDCAELLSKQPRVVETDLAIITNAGGPGVLAADSLADYGGIAAVLSRETLAKLDAVLPPYRTRTNPIDILGNATPERYRQVVEICMNAPEIKGILVILSPNSLNDPSEVAKALTEVLKGKNFPVFTTWMGGPSVEVGREIFNHAGIPTFDTPERAVRAFMDVHRYSKNLEMIEQIPRKLPINLKFDTPKAQSLIDGELERDNPLLTEVASKDLLSAYGIPVNPTRVAATAKEAWREAQAVGLPVVLKIHSQDISHKSEVAGVQLDLKNEFEVYGAFQMIMENAKERSPNASIDGVSVQPMLWHKGYELIVGAKRDRNFGPVILFGMGGAMTEVIQDRAIALPPLNRLLARRMMEETKLYRILKGFRNFLPANLDLLEEILIRVSQLVTDFPEIEELDINPLIVTQNNICAADARILLKPSEIVSPHHLIISSYPNQYEADVIAKDGEKIFVRPIRTEDAPIFIELFESLSPRSIYLRFFSPIKSLRHSMIVRFTQIDYDRETALVAIRKTDSKEEMLGVARVIVERNGKEAEFAVLVRDNLQGKGIGAELLGRCLEIAKSRGLEKVWGLVLPENTQMLALGRKLGFGVKRDPESGDYQLTIHFGKAASG